MDYSFTTEWVEGKSHLIAYALSHDQIQNNDRSRRLAYLTAPVLPSLDPNLNPLIQATQDCTSYQQLLCAVQETPPALFKKLPSTDPISIYKSYFEYVSNHDN